MDQISADLLLLIFKKLHSKEMVSVMRVERKWLQIIGEHKALWRELVLPTKNKDDEEEGWGLQALELFDRKSNSTLKRVSMDVSFRVESGPFVETLEKSKDTLRVLELTWGKHRVAKALEEKLWKFSNLMDCRLINASNWHYRLSLQLEERGEGQKDINGSTLRVLWISNLKELWRSHSYLLDGLVSLLLGGEDYDSSEMRHLLERPSRTLKHLEIGIQGEEHPQLPTLSFPNLKLLDFYFPNYSTSVFPSWMSLPSLSTLIIWNSGILSSLPACEKLWLISLDEFKDLSKLESQCPELVELRMDLNDVGRGDQKLSGRERFDNLSSMLSQRKVNVEAGMEIGGVKMINLKTLVISFDLVDFRGKNGLDAVGLSKLRELVEEVVDLSEAGSEIIEIEV